MRFISLSQRAIPFGYFYTLAVYFDNRTDRIFLVQGATYNEKDFSTAPCHCRCYLNSHRISATKEKLEIAKFLFLLLFRYDHAEHKKKNNPDFKTPRCDERVFLFCSPEAKRRKNSDVDILVKFKGIKSLFDFVGLKLELEAK